MDKRVQSVIIAFVAVLQAVRTRSLSRLYSSRGLTAPVKCADKDVLLKTPEQFCLMTIPITRRTVNTGAQCEAGSGRESYFVETSKEEAGAEYLPLADSKIDGKEVGGKIQCCNFICRGKKGQRCLQNLMQTCKTVSTIMWTRTTAE